VLARLARGLLALVLLAAWQAALVHPIEHVDELGAFVHSQSGHSDEGSPLCDELAALTACAAHAQVVFGELRSDYESPSYPQGAPRVAQAPPFLSQGPPFACV